MAPPFIAPTGAWNQVLQFNMIGRPAASYGFSVYYTDSRDLWRNAAVTHFIYMILIRISRGLLTCSPYSSYRNSSDSRTVNVASAIQAPC